MPSCPPPRRRQSQEAAAPAEEPDGQVPVDSLPEGGAPVSRRPAAVAVGGQEC